MMYLEIDVTVDRTYGDGARIVQWYARNDPERPNMVIVRILHNNFDRTVSSESMDISDFNYTIRCHKQDGRLMHQSGTL